MIVAKIRNLGQYSLGITIPNDIVNEKEIEEDDVIVITSFDIIKKEIEYRCGVCYCEFRDSPNEIEVECPSCGETHNLLKLKGGNENGR